MQRSRDISLVINEHVFTFGDDSDLDISVATTFQWLYAATCLRQPLGG